MAALELVSDYIREARLLLQDVIVPPRYTDAAIIDQLNNALIEIMRLRPDLVFKLMRTMLVPTLANPTDPVPVDYRYRPAVLSYVVGMAQLQDMEDNVDQRAAAFLQVFTARLMTTAA